MDLDHALKIALKAHAGQKDRGGAPYILHPLRLMMQMESEFEMLAAVLHDVIEDSSVTLDHLIKAGFAEEVIEAVDALTLKEGQSYDDYIEGCAANPIALKIKIADLNDNMNLRRILDLMEVDRERMDRYRRAYRRLTGEEWVNPTPGD